jgi:hypothetical protein
MPRNNAQQARRDSAYFIVRPAADQGPSHYVFLLITQEMASSPFPQPSGDVRGGVVDRAVLDTSNSA